MSPDQSLSDIHFLHSCLSSDVSISPMDNTTELDFPYIEPAWPSTKLWFLCCQMHSKSDITFLLQSLWVYLGLQGKVKATQWGRQGLSPLSLNLLSNLISSFPWPFILKQIMYFHFSVELPLPVIPSPLSYWISIHLLRPSWFNLLLVKPVKTSFNILEHNYFLLLCACSILHILIYNRIEV